MGVQKKTRKFAVAKRTIQLRDSRLYVLADLPHLALDCGASTPDYQGFMC